jgi:hypothetical protein
MLIKDALFHLNLQPNKKIEILNVKPNVNNWNVSKYMAVVSSICQMLIGHVKLYFALDDHDMLIRWLYDGHKMIVWWS